MILPNLRKRICSLREAIREFRELHISEEVVKRYEEELDKKPEVIKTINKTINKILPAGHPAIEKERKLRSDSLIENEKIKIDADRMIVLLKKKIDGKIETDEDLLLKDFYKEFGKIIK